MKHADTLLRGQRVTAFTITIALILASILTASGLLVLAQSRDSGDGTPVIGTIPDGTSASTVTIRPALDDETLIGQTTSFWTLTPVVARDALTDAGLPASSDPVSQLTGMVKSTGDASLAMRILSGVYARVTDGSHDPVGVFKGEGSARIMDGVYFAANSQGTMTVFHTPDTLYMAGLVDTGHVTEQDAVEQQQQLVTPDTTTDSADTTGDGVQAAPADTTADAVFTPAVLRTTPTGTARNTGYDNNDLRDSTFGVYSDPTLGDLQQTNSWTYGATDNGMRVVCIEGTAVGPSREGEKYSAQTIVPNKTQLRGETIRQDKFDHARNTLYWGYGGPGYKWAATLPGRNGKSELQELVEGNFTFHNGQTADGVDHGADWWENWFMSFVTHYMAASIMSPTTMESPTKFVNFNSNDAPVRAKAGDSSWGAVFDWFANPDPTKGRMFGNGPNNNGDANHMELVLLRPADIDNQGHQLLLGWRYHNYNLSITTQTWVSPVAWDNTGKEYAKPNTADSGAKYGENLPCKTSQAADGTWTSNSDCFHFYESVHDAITITDTGVTDKPNDHWVITVWFNMLTPNGKDTKTGKQGTHYSMALDSIDFSEIISAAAEINGKPNPSHSYTLNSSDVKPSEVIKKGNTNLCDDYGHPYNENEEGHWPRNSKFWFDVTLGPKEGATVYGSAESTHEGASRTTKQDGGQKVTTEATLTDAKEAFSTPGTRLGLKTEFRSDSGRKDKNGETVWDKGKAPALGKSQPVLDHLRINPLDSVLSGGRLDCVFTLKYSPTGYGKDVKASKTLDKAEPINGTWLQGAEHETDSPQFTPTDLGMKAWMPGYYWFDVTVTRASVAAASGLKADSYSHEGAQDTTEKWTIQRVPPEGAAKPSITSQTVDANGKTLGNTTRLHDGKPSKDKVTVTLKPTTPGITVSGVTLIARGELWWSPTPGAQGQQPPVGARKVTDLTPLRATPEMLADGTETLTYDPASDPKVKGLEGLGSGYYTYVWRLSKADLGGQTATISWQAAGRTVTVTNPADQTVQGFPISGIIRDGWQPAREQIQQDAQWTLNITKTTCIGNNTTACTWDPKQPVQGAKLTLTETDTNWKPKTGAKPITLTTGKDGKASTGTQHIGSGETRRYTLTETSVPKPYAKPRNGAWHVTVTQTPGTRGARVTMQATGDALQNGTSHAASGTPAANTATGIQNQAEAWTAEIGNLRPISAMPPQTGWTHDAGHLLAIGIITTIVTGMGIAFALHRRHTHVKNMGRHEA